MSEAEDILEHADNVRRTLSSRDFRNASRLLKKLKWPQDTVACLLQDIKPFLLDRGGRVRAGRGCAEVLGDAWRANLAKVDPALWPALWVNGDIDPRIGRAFAKKHTQRFWNGELSEDEFGRALSIADWLVSVALGVANRRLGVFETLTRVHVPDPYEHDIDFGEYE